MKYQDLLKENKTLQKKIEVLKSENKETLNLASNLNKQVIELKVEIIRLTKEKEKLLNELKENPVAELMRMVKGLDIF